MFLLNLLTEIMKCLVFPFVELFFAFFVMTMCVYVTMSFGILAVITGQPIWIFLIILCICMMYFIKYK